MSLELAALSARHPAARSGTAAALQDLTLSIAEGEHVAVIGPSGAGKTTLLQVMAAALPPSAGTLRIETTGAGPAVEVLVPTPGIRTLIREDKIHQIYSMMQTGQDKFGMQTFNQALATLHHKRVISLETAMQRSSNADELKELIERGSGLNDAYANTHGARPMNRPMPGSGSPYAQGRPIGERPRT